MSPRLSTVIRCSLLACLPLALATVLPAQSNFEGVITMRLTTPQGPSDVAYSVKGTQFRMDMGMGNIQAYMLRNAADGAMLMVLPAQHMYMSTPMAAATDAAGRATGAMKVPELKMTGRKETVAGYECEHVIITGDDGTENDACVAKGLGTFMLPANPMGRGRGAPPGGAASIADKLGRDFFPLKVQKVGGPVQLEVTKIEKKSLDDATFAIPSGYQKMDMGGLMGGRPPR